MPPNQLCHFQPVKAVTMALQRCCWTVTWWERELVFTVSSFSLDAGSHHKKKNIQFSVWKRKDYFPCPLCRKLLLLIPFPLVLSALQLHYSTDSMEVKPIMTRKLRRRPNDPVPIPDKRRKPAPDILLQSHWRAIIFEASMLPASMLFCTGRKMKLGARIRL